MTPAALRRSETPEKSLKGKAYAETRGLKSKPRRLKPTLLSITRQARELRSLDSLVLNENLEFFSQAFRMNQILQQ